MEISVITPQLDVLLDVTGFRLAIETRPDCKPGRMLRLFLDRRGAASCLLYEETSTDGGSISGLLYATRNILVEAFGKATEGTCVDLRTLMQDANNEWARLRKRSEP